MDTRSTTENISRNISRLPKMNVAGQPDLTRVLNLIVGAVNRIQIPQLSQGVGVRIRQIGGQMVIEADPAEVAAAIAANEDHPYKLEWVDDRAEAAPDPDWKIKVHIGAINGVIVGTWLDLLDIPVYENLYYIVLNCTVTDNYISGVTYSVETTHPDNEDVDPVTKNIMPSSFKVILGAVQEGEVYQVVSTNLTATAVEAIKVPKEGVIPEGSLAYDLWYKMKVEAA